MGILLDEVAVLILARQRVGGIGLVQADVAVAVVLELEDVQIRIESDPGQLGRLQAHDINLAVLQGGQAGASLRDDTDDLAVHVGRALPKAVVALHGDEVVPLPLLEAKGLGRRGGRRVERTVHDVGEVLGIQVAGQPAQTQIKQAVALEVGERHLNSQVVDDLNIFDARHVGLARRLHQFTGNRIVGELEVVGIHGLAVAPGDARAQVERPDQGVLGNGPAFGHLGGLDGTGLGVGAQKAREIRHHVETGRVGGQDRVQDGAVGTAGLGPGSALNGAGRSRFHGCGHGHGGTGRQQRQHKRHQGCTGQQPAPSKSLHVLSPLSVRDRRLKRIVRSRKYADPGNGYSSFRKQAA